MAGYFWLAAVIGAAIGYMACVIRYRRHKKALSVAVSMTIDLLATAIAEQPDLTQRQREYWHWLLDKEIAERE